MVINNNRIVCVRPLIPPQILMEGLPKSFKAAETVLKGRKGVENILTGVDDRLLVVVGPCSIHEVKAALEYGKLLKEYAEHAKDDLHIVMRVYFEKPRTTVGWKGLINDPQLNNSFEINKGLRIARQLLLDLNEMGMPAGCEFLDAITPQYTSDLVSWGAIGARTTESQVHRELVSGLPCPIGFKNSTDGSLSVAIDAIQTARHGHHFLTVTKQGISAIVETSGHDLCHIILRGGKRGPNYSAEHIQTAVDSLDNLKLRQRVMIDCSHGNSLKDHKRQVLVAEEITEQLKVPSKTGNMIFGVMIESNLVEGRQDIPEKGSGELMYGKSVTDACIGWKDTIKVLDKLRKGVSARRAALKQK